MRADCLPALRFAIGRATPPIKKPITLRVDTDVLASLQRQGRGYQTRINRALRKLMMDERKRSGEWERTVVQTDCLPALRFAIGRATPPITLRVDADVLAWFQRQGQGLPDQDQSGAAQVDAGREKEIRGLR